MMVTMCVDGDGFDDGSIKGDSSGNFALPATLVEGLNTLLIRTVDSFGQQKTATINIKRDTTAPTFSNVGLASGYQVAGAAGHTTARAVMITGTSEPLSTLSGNGATATAGADGSFSLSDVGLGMGVK